MPVFCRTCLIQLEEDEIVFFLDKEDPGSVAMWIKTKLESCVPEMRVGAVKQPAICQNCVNKLDTANQFRTTCLQTEQRLYEYIISCSVNMDYVNIEDVVKRCNNGVGGGSKLFGPNEDKAQRVRGLKRKRNGSLVCEDSYGELEDDFYVDVVGGSSAMLSITRKEAVDYVPEILGECIELVGDDNERLVSSGDPITSAEDNPAVCALKSGGDSKKSNKSKSTGKGAKISQETVEFDLNVGENVLDLVQRVESTANLQESSTAVSLASCGTPQASSESSLMDVAADDDTRTISQENGDLNLNNSSNHDEAPSDCASGLEQIEPEVADPDPDPDIKEEEILPTEEVVEPDDSQFVEESDEEEVGSHNAGVLLGCVMCSYTCEYESVLLEHLKTHSTIKHFRPRRFIEGLPESDEPDCYGFAKHELIPSDCAVCSYTS